MSRRRAASRMAFAIALALVAGVARSALVSDVEAARCSCGSFYSPVKCDNGKICPNQCYATCHVAKNCFPIGPPLP